MQSADGLEFYLAVIQNEDRDIFDTVLSSIGERSGIRQGNRLSMIAPNEHNTIYEVSLGIDEAVILALACPGRYMHCPNEENRHNMISLLISRYYNG